MTEQQHVVTTVAPEQVATRNVGTAPGAAMEGIGGGLVASPEVVLALQRTAGNTAVSRWLSRSRSLARNGLLPAPDARAEPGVEELPEPAVEPQVSVRLPPAPAPATAPAASPAAAGLAEGSGVAMALGPAAAAGAVLLYPASAGEAWETTINPFTGGPYRSPEEYAHIQRYLAQHPNAPEQQARQRQAERAAVSAQQPLVARLQRLQLRLLATRERITSMPPRPVRSDMLRHAHSLALAIEQLLPRADQCVNPNFLTVQIRALAREVRLLEVQSRRYVPAAADLEHLRAVAGQLRAGLPASQRNRDSIAIAVGLAETSDGGLTLVYTTSQNYSSPGVNTAAQSAGAVRLLADPRVEAPRSVNPKTGRSRRVSGRGVHGSPTDAEQLLIEAAMAGDLELIAVAPSLAACPDCARALRAEHVTIVDP
ncbi:hypothetical protein [Solirubrobacter soli]|uniref:hypothetical protein n=1 Tax=Solirubrobacter soli TaxID=363832 RepID=UPI0004218FE0|nr:hypothetical protein [Solirubrobacter soli]